MDFKIVEGEGYKRNPCSLLSCFKFPRISKPSVVPRFGLSPGESQLSELLLLCGFITVPRLDGDIQVLTL